MNPSLTKEQTELLIHAARRAADGVFAIHKGDHVDLSLAGDAGRPLLRLVAADPALYIAAFEDLVELGYMKLVDDARLQGGNELKYVITPPGRARVAKPTED